MRAIIQRVARASVTIAGQVSGRIEQGLVVLLGIGQEDKPEDARWLAQKIVSLRIFPDAEGKMNLTLGDVGHVGDLADLADLAEVKRAMLVISQFTLYGDCRKGRRPSFIGAAPPAVAIPLYEQFIQAVRELGVEVQTGEFGADMQVELVNDGPVTLILDTEDNSPHRSKRT